MSDTTAEPWWEVGRPPALPPDPDLEPLHNRDYTVRVWKRDERSMLLRGAVMDRRPGDFLAVPLRAAGGDDDGRPFTVHHMVVELVVSTPDLVIEDAEVLFETAPHGGCPAIAPNYRDLIGVSIARGFSRVVRELFGGPRGCAHTTALLQAMAPAAMQATFALRSSTDLDRRPGGGEGEGGAVVGAAMRDTCHLWAESGPFWQGALVGELPPIPVTYRRRIRDAGLDPADFDERLRG